MSDKSIQIIDTISCRCIGARVRLLNRVITGLYDNALRPLGVKASQFNVLVVAGKLGLARPAEVCEILRLDTSTLSRNVERMRTQGVAGNCSKRRRSYPTVPSHHSGQATGGAGSLSLEEGPAGSRATLGR